MLVVQSKHVDDDDVAATAATANDVDDRRTKNLEPDTALLKL